MTRLTAVAAALALCLLTGAGAGAAAPPPDAASVDAARRGAAYMATTQGDDGAMAAGWRPDQVAEAVMAVHAAGGQDGAVARALAFLQANGDADASSGPFAGRIVSALVSVGADPRNFGGVNYVARIKSFYEPATGEYGGPNLYADALAMLGLLAAGEKLPDQSVNRVVLTQCDDGGWTHAVGCTSNRDVDTTAAVLAVVVAVRGADSEPARDGRAWLAAARNADTGCWGYTTGADDNANSCALALNAIVSLGESPHAAPWASGDKDATTALRALQLPSGAFRYMANKDEPNKYATVQTVFALAGGWYPTRPPVPPGGDDDDDDPPPVTGTTGPGGTRHHVNRGGTTSGGDDDLGTPGGGTDLSTPGESEAQATEAPTTTAAVRGRVLSALGGDARLRPGKFGGVPSILPTDAGTGDAPPLSVTDESGSGGGRGPALAAATGLLAGVGAGVGWWGRRRSALAALGLLSLLAVPLVGVAAAPEACLAAPGEVSVRVVVDFGTLDDAPPRPTNTTCVTVPTGASGADVLEARADKLGLPAPRYDPSGLLCAIDGYPAKGCGEQTAKGYRYWGYYQGTKKGWDYAEVGPAEQKVSAGATEGWRFNDGSGPENPPPREPPDPGCTPEEEGTPLTLKEEEGNDGFPVGAVVGAVLVSGLVVAGIVFSRRRSSS